MVLSTASNNFERPSPGVLALPREDQRGERQAGDMTHPVATTGEHHQTLAGGSRRRRGDARSPSSVEESAVDSSLPLKLPIIDLSLPSGLLHSDESIGWSREPKASTSGDLTVEMELKWLSVELSLLPWPLRWPGVDVSNCTVALLFRCLSMRSACYWSYRVLTARPSEGAGGACVLPTVRSQTGLGSGKVGTPVPILACLRDERRNSFLVAGSPERQVLVRSAISAVLFDWRDHVPYKTTGKSDLRLLPRFCVLVFLSPSSRSPVRAREEEDEGPRSVSFAEVKKGDAEASVRRGAQSRREGQRGRETESE
ncbi:hypothetical protein AXG93_2556s1130 [Marchantia polymorpha subsp. ruderalis]|uniref:Uncharacterized protein n=1 Tax=Marchantia polymorpha subsp. ruderalis TaxID=1480154 RepID=A0A176VEM4_MARPO|nr:hypothetical protein AXG93_2556s1130 [Marchantia polymorpha subsp. ruderalis]